MGQNSQEKGKKKLKNTITLERRSLSSAPSFFRAPLPLPLSHIFGSGAPLALWYSRAPLRARALKSGALQKSAKCRLMNSCKFPSLIQKVDHSQISNCGSVAAEMLILKPPLFSLSYILRSHFMKSLILTPSLTPKSFSGDDKHLLK